MHYNYNVYMGIMIDSTAIPDPSSWKYQVGDLDTSGSRDAKGLLHRAYVATKINYEFEWKAIEWEMLELILKAVNKSKFKLVAPDPRNFKKKYVGDYYVGDRTGECKYYIPQNEYSTGNPIKPEVAVYDLKLKFIEY